MARVVIGLSRLATRNRERPVEPDIAPLVAGATTQARQRGHAFLAPLHFVLAAFEDETVRGRLTRLGIDPERARARVEAAGILEAGLGASDSADRVLPWLNTIDVLIRHIRNEARRDGDSPGWTHVVGAVLRAGVAPEALLAREGITLATLEGRPAFSVTIDDTSSVPIFEQIVHRVREAAASRLLLPGDRLPPVRELADRLDIAPGTVARAYAILEANGLVATEGARGTRIAASARSSIAEGTVVIDALLRRAVVEAHHAGWSAVEIVDATRRAMTGIYAE